MKTLPANKLCDYIDEQIKQHRQICQTLANDYINEEKPILKERYNTNREIIDTLQKLRSTTVIHLHQLEAMVPNEA